MTNLIYPEQVTDRLTFIQFVEALKADFDNNPTGWQNNKLSDFLGALSTYAEDVQGYYDNTHQSVNADVASWKTFADLLMGARVYE